MQKLLKVEWLKLKNYRTFWILSALYLISNYGVNYIAFRIQQEVIRDMGKSNMGRAIMGNPPFSFPDVWHTASFMCSFLLFIPGLLIIISVTNEYSYKTHRQNIVDGWSRRQFILVKLALVGIISLFASVMAALTGLIFGLQSGTSFSLAEFQYVGYFLVQALSYCSVALVFALLLKRSGLAIGVYFLYIVVLENLLGGLMSYGNSTAGRYLPLNSTDYLIPFPFLRRVTETFLDAPNYSILLPLAFAYLALYFIFSVRKFERDDL